jgi:serine/threonine protein kinase
LERLGSGGTSEVWRAVDAQGREAALKRLRPPFDEDPRALALLQREYRWLRELAHPSFVAPLGLVSFNGTLALALEYLPGGDLVPLLGGPASHWLAPFAAVVAGVAALHERGLAHGDVKARNVLFAADGAPRLIDFASVQPLGARVAVPAGWGEARCRSATAREADGRAVAALLFELLTGRSPDGAPREAPASEGWPARELFAAASAVIASGGQGGLSVLRDVIESVAAAPSASGA